MAEGYALAFFVEMDTNEDGEITEEEFVEGCLNNEIAKNDKLRLRIETIEKEKKDLNREIDKRDSLIEAEKLRS